MAKTIATKIAATLNAWQTSRNNCNTQWEARHLNTLDRIMKNTSPSGSGIDCGTKLLKDKCKDDKLVFLCEFHHMNDVGYYEGWTQHTITARPSLMYGIDIKISGRDRNQIKDYLYDVYATWLKTELTDKEYWS